MNNNQNPQDDQDPDKPQINYPSPHSHKKNGNNINKAHMAKNAGKTAGKAAAKGGKAAVKGTKAMVSSGVKTGTFIAANASWLAIIGGILMAVMIVVSLFVGLVSDDDDCDSGGGSVSANFKITDVLSEKGNKSKQIEEWCASKHLDAAQTAGILGNAMAESTLGTATSNLLGMGANPSEASSDTAATSGDSVSKYLDTFISHFSTQNCKHYIDDMKDKSPSEDGYWWGANIEHDGAGNNTQRGKFADDFYKKIAGGSSTVNDADSTADSGDSSSGSCGQSGDDSDGNIIQYGEKFIGLGYSEGTHVQGAEDIGNGKSKSDSNETDCSGFVWGVLKHLGYGVTPQPWTVGSGAAENEYFKEHHETVSKPETHAGTVVMANENAHTAFLMEKWHGPSTKVLEEGGYGMNCNKGESYQEAFGSNNGPDEFANPKKK